MGTKDYTAGRTYGRLVVTPIDIGHSQSSNVSSAAIGMMAIRIESVV